MREIFNSAFLHGGGFRFYIPRWTVSTLLLLLCLNLSAQSNFKIKGIVLSESNKEPLIGVNVIQKGTSNGTITNIDGVFELTVPAPCDLLFSYIGYNDKLIKVKEAANDIHLLLSENNEQLDEVVVIGYGVQKKKLITGATVQVKGDDIQKLNTINALGALQSQTPGVNITQSSGMPGEGFKVTIRGLGTTGNAGPLYIIDGVTGADINALNPADIESFDVLKDAASAAIYGSRAANGVVLVTTKQGRVGKASISYDGYVGVQNVYRMPDLLNAQEYALIQNEARMMDGLPGYNFAKEVPNWDKIANGTFTGTNWMEEARNENAPIQNHALNIIGGTDQSVYSIGLSYTSQEGILGKPVEPNYSRYTFRLNTEHTLYKKNNLDIIKVGENLSYTYSERAGIAIGDIWWNDIRSLLTASPFMPLRNEAGEYHYAIPWDSREANPIARMDYTHGQNATKSHNMKANVFLTIQPIKNLLLKSNFGLLLAGNSSHSFIPAYDLSSNLKGPESIVSQSMGIGVNWQWENTLSYQFNLGNHNLSALIGQAVEKSGMGESMEGTNFNSKFNDLKHAYLSNTGAISGRSLLRGYPWERSIIASFFGRVNYDYKNKYMATAVLRADGSSNFMRGKRWGYFPSVSAGWAVSEEAFMEPTREVLDFLKLRASFGQNGNQAILPFQYLSTISFANASYFFGPDKSSPTSGGFPDILPNKDVTWETSEQFDLGIDARLLNNRLGITFDYYIKTTKDWLVQAPILDSYGAAAPFINGGDVRNKGFEIALNWNDNIGDFRYGLNVNLSHNENEVTRIANTEGIIHGAPNILSNATDEMYRAQVGYPIGYFWGYETAGVFQNDEQIKNYKGAMLSGTRPGDLIFVDADGNGTIDEKDKGMIGNPHPDFNLGLGINLSYKGFDLSATASGAFGNQIAKSYRSFADLPKQNYTSDIFARWHGDGTSNKLPRLSSVTSTNWQYISDIYIEDGDYLKLQNLTIGYDFKTLFKGMPLQQARLYVAAQNLFTITEYSGMDPEIGYGSGQGWVSGIDLGFYPSPRTLLIGVNLKF